MIQVPSARRRAFRRELARTLHRRARALPQSLLARARGRQEQKPRRAQRPPSGISAYARALDADRHLCSSRTTGRQGPTAGTGASTRDAAEGVVRNQQLLAIDEPGAPARSPSTRLTERAARERNRMVKLVSARSWHRRRARRCGTCCPAWSTLSPLSQTSATVAGPLEPKQREHLVAWARARVKRVRYHQSRPSVLGPVEVPNARRAQGSRRGARNCGRKEGPCAIELRRREDGIRRRGCDFPPFLEGFRSIGSSGAYLGHDRAEA